MNLAQRVWKSLSLLFVAVLVLSACATPAAAPAGGEASGDGDGAMAMDLPEGAAAEQVLRINTGSTGAASFDFYPMRGGSDNQNWMPFLYVPPMYFDVDLNLQPGVFNSWESNDDATAWTFTIDPAARWSDGTPITADQVVGTWTLMTDPLTEMGRIPQYIGNVQGFAEERDAPDGTIEGFNIVDDSTIEVSLVNADAIFHWRIATTHMNPIKVEQVEADPLNFWLPENSPAVSGPFMLESFDPDLQTANMVPNPNWWMDEGPYLERIEFIFQPEPDTTAVMLQNDQADLNMTGIPFAMKDQFPDFFRPVKAFGFNSFWLASTVEPTDDVNVRKALILSVDGDAIFQAAFPEGNGVQANQLLDPDLVCLEQEMSWWDFDVEAAKQAIADSKYGSVENLPKIRITPRGTDTVNNRALEAVMEQWRQNLGLTNIEFQQQPDAFGDDAELINLSRDDAVIRFPDTAQYVWVSAHTDGPIARGDMMRGYSNAEVDSLLEEALSLAADDPQRCELALEAQRAFMDDYQFLFIGIGISTLNARDYVVNYEKGPDIGVIAPWRIYIAEH